MNPRPNALIRSAMVILIFACFGYYVWKHFRDFAYLRFAHTWLIMPIIILTVTVTWFLGLMIKYLLEPFGIRLKFREWFGLSVVSTLYNTITPFRGGMIARALYLKEKHKFPYTSFLATMSGIYVINFFIQGLAGLISAAVIYIKSGVFSPVIIAVFGGFFAGSLIMIIFSPKLKPSNNVLLNKMVEIINGWHIIRDNKKVIFIASLTALAQLILTAAALSLAYKMFGLDVDIVKTVFLSSVSLLGIVVSITPGALGIAEAISVFSALTIGITVAHSLSAAVLIRLAGLVLIFTLGPVYSYILLKHGPVFSRGNIDKTLKEN